MADPKGSEPEFNEPSEPGEPSQGDDSHVEPAEEMDFSDSPDFAFPSEPASEGEVPADYSPPDYGPADENPADENPADEGPPSGMFGAGDATGEFFPGAEAAGSAEPVQEGEDAVVEADEAVEGVEVDAEPEEKPKWHMPAWLDKVQWTVVALVAVGLFILDIVAAVWFSAPAMINTVWFVSYLVLLVLIPYSLWRSRKLWTTPEASSIYTVLLAIGAAALWTGVYWLVRELAQYEWEIKAKKAPIAAVGAPMLPAERPVADA